VLNSGKRSLAEAEAALTESLDNRQHVVQSAHTERAPLANTLPAESKQSKQTETPWLMPGEFDVG